MSIIMQSMVIYMNEQQLQTLEQLQAFLDGTAAIDLQLAPAERYACISRTLRRFGYAYLKRAQKAVVLRFLERVSGYSRQQLTRLVKRGVTASPLKKRYRASSASFSAHYTPADVQSLADIDTLHGTLSGPATKKLMERAWGPYGDARYERLVNEFCAAHLNSYINFHRPFLYAETPIDPNGRQRKRYPYQLMMTPYEKFKSMPQATKYLKPGLSFQQLDAFAGSISDNDAARHLNAARSKLFKEFSRRSISAA